MVNNINKQFIFNHLVFWIVLIWVTQIFFLVHYLPLLQVVGRIQTLAFLICAALVWMKSLNSDTEFTIKATIFVGAYGFVTLAVSYLNGHWFVFEDRGSLMGFTYHFVLFLFCLIAARMRRYSSGKDEKEWILMVPFIAMLVLSLNFYRFVSGSLTSIMERKMIYEGVNSINLGYLSGLLSVAMFALATRLKMLVLKIVGATIGVILFVTLVTVAARGAMLYSLMAIAVLVVINLRRLDVSLKMLLPVVGIGTILGLTLFLIRPEFINIRFGLLAERFQEIFYVLKGDQFAVAGDASSGRLEIWGYFLEQIGSWWFMGLKGYNGLLYPHNSIIEAGVRFGLFGIPIIILLGMVLRKIFLHWKAGILLDPIDVAVSVVFIFCLLQSMTSMSLDMFRALWASAGYIVGMKAPQKIGDLRVRRA